MANKLRVTLDVPAKMLKEIDREVRQSIELTKSNLLAQINRKVGKEIGKVLVQDAVKQMDSQGTFLGKRYKDLSDQYAAVKYYYLAKLGKVKKLTPPQRGNLSSTQFQDKLIKFRQQRSAMVQKIAKGKLGAKILELTGIMGDEVANTVPVINQQEKGVLRIRIIASRVRTSAHQTGYKAAPPRGGLANVPARPIFRTGVSETIKKLIKGIKL